MIDFTSNTYIDGTFSEQEFKSLMNGNIIPSSSALLSAINLPKKGEQTVVIISLKDDGYYRVKAIRM